MSATAVSSSTPRDGFSSVRASTPGVPSKAERLLALGDSHRPINKRASSDGNRFISLLTARKELRSRLDRIPNDELVRTSGWAVDYLFESATTTDIRSFAPSSTGSKAGVLRKQPPSSRNTYYDPSKVPLRVSQQTSASAMRDMGLHKHVAVLEAPASDLRPRPSNAEPQARRNKLDKLLGATDYPSNNNAKLDITSYFTTPRPLTSVTPNLPRKHSNPMTASDQSSYGPPSISELPKRPTPSRAGVSGLQISAPQLTSFNSTVNLRPLPRAEEDMLKNAKMHRHRPPKGSSNWFDGLDVSSDDDDFDDDLDLSRSQTSNGDHRADQRAAKRMSKRLSKLKEHFERNARDSHLARSSTQAASNRLHPSLRNSHSLADLHADLHAESTHVDSSTQPSNTSVFSLDSLDDFDEAEQINSDPDISSAAADGVQYGEAAHIDISKVRAKRLSHRPSYQRETSATTRGGSMDTNANSGTIPVRLASDLHIPQRSRTSSRYSSIAHIAPHLVASEAPTAPGHPRSSSSNDTPHMMEVTEEEMALLEMMRQKRATMAKSHPSEKAAHATSRQSTDISSTVPAARVAALRPSRSNYSLDLNGSDAAPHREYHDGIARMDDPLEHHSAVQDAHAWAQSAAAVLHTSISSTRPSSQMHRPATAYASASNLVAPKPLSPRSARRTQEMTSHTRSFTHTVTTPLLDLHTTPMPHRDHSRIPPARPLRTTASSENDESDSNQARGISGPPDSTDDARQSICSTLPDTAPVSLPMLSSAVYRPREAAHTPTTSSTSKSSGARPSPRVVLTNALTQSSQLPANAPQSRSVTAAPGTQPTSASSRDALPSNGDRVIRKQSDPSMFETVRLNPLCMNPPLEFAQATPSSAPSTRAAHMPAPASTSRNTDHGLPRSPSVTVSTESPETPVGVRSMPTLQTNFKPRQLAKSPTIESLKHSTDDAVGKRGSMMSMTSVGEDVLAAWAELGGGTLHFRF